MYILIFIVLALLIFIDQLVKYLCLSYLKPQGTIVLIENIFSLTFVENRGAAFGIFQGNTILLTLVSLAIIGFLVWYFLKLPQGKVYTYIKCTLVLIIAGAIGNLIDRLRLGYVVDMFEATFIDFPVFNVADMYIVVGTILMGILIMFFVKEDKEQEKK